MITPKLPILAFLSLLLRLHIIFGQNLYTPIGDAIISDYGGDSAEFFGGVDISGNGLFVAIGSPNAGVNGEGEVKVYRSIPVGDTEEWRQFGKTIIGDGPNFSAGISVSLSENGNFLAVGSLGSEDEEGVVQLFRYRRRKDWTLVDTVNSTLSNLNENDRFGFSVDLSANGKILAIGSDPVELDDFPYVQIYRCWNNQGHCARSGTPLPVIRGNTVSMASSGKLLAVGAPSETEQVKIYTRDQSSYPAWTELADPPFQPFIGQSDNLPGFSTTLSGDGNTVAFSSVRESCTDTDGKEVTFCGVVRIYSIDENDGYKALGDPIVGAEGALLGLSLDISETGRTMIVTSINIDANAVATIYNYREDTLKWESVQSFEGGFIDAFRVFAALSSNGERAIFLSPGNNFETKVVRVYGTTPAPPPPPDSCVNNKNFRFRNQKNKPKKCFFITKKPNHIEKFCKGDVAENCKKACKLC